MVAVGIGYIIYAVPVAPVKRGGFFYTQTRRTPMWKPILAFLAASAVAVPAVALAAGGESTPAPPPAAPTPACTPLKTIYSEHRWREPHPLRGQTPCPADRSATGLRRHFFDYRRYRQIAPYRCIDGDEGYFAVPCYIVACETGGSYSWSTYNPSSNARGPYQFVGWRVPWPVRSFRDRLAHHIQAAAAQPL